MAQKKLVSVRLIDEDLATIDDWAKDARYHTRTDVIDSAVRLAAWCIRHNCIMKLLLFFPKYDTVDAFKFDYHRDHILITPKQ